jgi:hypothetical protein
MGWLKASSFSEDKNNLVVFIPASGVYRSLPLLRLNFFQASLHEAHIVLTFKWARQEQAEQLASATHTPPQRREK